MAEKTLISDVATRLRDAYGAAPIPPVRGELPELDVNAAYAVQEENTNFWVSRGRRIVGAKIGLTSRAVQKQLGVDRPDFGVLFADMLVHEDEPIAVGRVSQPKIEAEVAFLLDRNLDNEQPTVADCIRSIAYVMPALEIVGSRIANWDIGIVDTVADNASAGLYVLGGPVRRLDGLDLRAIKMEMRRGAEPISRGTGAACLGNPLNALAWLAAEMRRRTQPLRAGDVVLSGALGPMAAVNVGDVIVAELAGLGTVTAKFAAS